MASWNVAWRLSGVGTDHVVEQAARLLERGDGVGGPPHRSLEGPEVVESLGHFDAESGIVGVRVR